MRNIIHRTILALVLLAGVVPAFGQVPPPIPALPDTERRTTYSITASLCSCNVNFALYGDSTDVANWLEVFVNGVRITQPGNWTITSPTGSIATIPRPITNAVLTFTAAQTGTVQIVGARRPRRASQFTTQPSARDFNQVLTDIIAQNRETWDKINDVTGRTVQAPAGETLAMLPVLASRQNMGACFDSGGNLQPCVAAGSTSFIAGSGILFTGTNPTTISSPLLSANNTWTGDQYFKSGRPWVDVRAYSATGDGVTDDTTAIQNAINAAEAVPFGGAVYVPAGKYCVKSGPVILNGAGTIFMGASRATTLSTCGSDNSIIKMTNGNQSVLNFQLLGRGFYGDTSTFGSSFPVLLLQGTGGGCAQCIVDSLNIQGGSVGISISPPAQSGEFYIYRTDVAYTYGSALVYLSNGVGWFERDKFDQAWPVSPTNGQTINAWAAATVYTGGQVVTTGGYYIVCKTGGTSAGSAPTLKNFGSDITDNTVTWMLAGATGSSAMQIDTGTFEIYGHAVDFTGATAFGVSMTNTLAGTAPSNFKCHECIAGQTVSNTLNMTAGFDVWITDSTIGGPISAAGVAVIFNSSFVGRAIVKNSQIVGAAAGAVFATGARYTVEGNIFSAITSQGVAVQGATSGVIVNGNNFSGGTNGVNISGTADYYNIVNNICGGAVTTCVADTGSGTHKTLTGNN